MREIYLRGFEICIKEAKPESVMTSYNLLNGEHTTERIDLVEDILRAEFGFDGVVMTDWIVKIMTSNKEDKYPSVQPYKTAIAGVSLYMPESKDDYKDMVQAFKAGRLTREHLERNASRLYRKYKKDE